jgi:hypothetical protein
MPRAIDKRMTDKRSKKSEAESKPVAEKKSDALCEDCGEEFSSFLHQMEEHNAKVVLPSSGKPGERNRPKKAVKPPRPNKSAGS